jgi:hypothetical protein
MLCARNDALHINPIFHGVKEPPYVSSSTDRFMASSTSRQRHDNVMSTGGGNTTYVGGGIDRIYSYTYRTKTLFFGDSHGASSAESGF